jgi:signal transduction histidine kinase
MGRFNFDTGPVDYTRLIQDVAAEMQLVCPDNPIRIVVPDDVSVHGNENRLRQVLVNLIDNAVKYGPDGGTIEIRVAPQEEEILTSVCDQGAGLPVAEAERIFNPYYQIPDEASRGLQGLGLGLYISRQIVAEHGGRIWLDASDGTCISFAVPKSKA